MDILVFIDSFGTDSMGGARRVFFETGKLLAKNGNRVRAICRKDGYFSGGKMGGIEFIVYDDFPGGQLKKLIHYRRKIATLADAEISASKPDLAIFHSSSAVFGLRKIKPLKDIPKVYYFHSPWNREYEIARQGKTGLLSSFLSKIRKGYDRRNLKWANGIVVLSEYMKGELVSEHPAAGKKPTVVIPGGADTEIFRPPENHEEKKTLRAKFGFDPDIPIILTTRRLVKRTGVDILIEAFAAAKDRFPDGSKLVITGDGPLRRNLVRIAKNKGISGDVVFTGFLEREELPEYYRLADLYVLPTLELEGFGLSTVEALSSGLPVVATNVGGTKEILDKVPARLLVPPGDIHTLSEKMVWALNNPDIKETGKQGRNLAEKTFNWKIHCKRLIEFAYGITC